VFCVDRLLSETNGWCRKYKLIMCSGRKVIL
jgi:hypothetical protein